MTNHYMLYAGIATVLCSLLFLLEASLVPSQKFLFVVLWGVLFPVGMIFECYGLIEEDHQ